MEIIEAYLEDLREQGSPESTLTGRRGILYRLNRDLTYGIGQVTPDELRAWLYRANWSQNTRATYYRGLKSFYGWASDPQDPWLNDNPMIGLPKVDTPKGYARACTDDEAKKVLTESAEPFRLWANIAAYQGLRCIEISRADREHITERQLFVVRGKGGRPRVHDTDELIWDMVKGLPPGPIAIDPRTGRRATAHYISVYSARYFHTQLGVPVSLHRLRHWMGVNVQRAFKNIRVTQAMLGHVSLASTQIYTEATDEEQRAARSTLPRFGE